MEKILNQVLDEIKGLKQGQDGLKTNVDVMRDDISGVKTDLHGLKQVTDSISEQTAELTEFRTEMNEKLDYLVENQKSLFEMYGEHEVKIRNLRRRPV